MAKIRLDQMLVQQELASSRERGKRLVMAGSVYVNGQRVDKPGTAVSADSLVEVRGNAFPFVSRGGLKLEKAFSEFDFDVKNCSVIDVGASTGGFTDCLLQHGARRVYAVDVGYGQLDWKLRTDERVVVMERTNIRHLRAADLPEVLDAAVVDVAFISLTKFFGTLLALLCSGADAVVLIKPQFEAGKHRVGKKGVVRDWGVHREVLSMLCRTLQAEGAGLQDLTYSPIRGPEGNVEYLAHLQKGAPIEECESRCLRVVEMAEACMKLG